MFLWTCAECVRKHVVFYHHHDLTFTIHVLKLTLVLHVILHVTLSRQYAIMATRIKGH